jgi:hypothetical protein
LAKNVSLHGRSRNSFCSNNTVSRVARAFGYGPKNRPGSLRAAAVEADARVILLRRDVQIREALVVAQRDVVARTMTLDQVVFEQQRLRFPTP